MQNQSNRLDAVITVDEVDSNGRLGRPLPVATARPVAFSVKEKTWYGFAIRHADVEIIEAGSSAFVSIEFLDSVGATSALPRGCPILFGDGVISRGTLVLRDQ